MKYFRSLLAILVACFPLFLQSQNQRPWLNQPLSPTSVAPGAGAFTLSISGTGFISGAVVEWNGSARSTKFVSSTQVTASIAAADVANPGTAVVSVANPAPGGGVSNTILFPITFPFTNVAFVSADYPASSNELNDVVVADFNGDGIKDLAIANPCGTTYPCPNNGTVSILLGNADGSFQAPISFPAGSVTEGLVEADFNGDGKADLAVINPCGTHGWNCGNAQGNVVIWLGNGDGTFNTGASYDLGVFPYHGLTADLNRDGKLDLAIFNIDDGTVSVLLGKGDGTFSSAGVFPCGNTPEGFAAGDFNGDGKLDLAVGNYPYPSTGNALNILLGNGDGTFQAPVGYDTGENFQAPAVADFNGDGILDLALPGTIDNQVWVFLGRGDGTFQSPTAFASGTYPSQVVPADINGDGKLDLIVASSNSSNISILLGNGGGSFQAPTLLTADFRPATVALGDFNSDGRLDIATANINSISTTVLLGATANVSPTSLGFGLFPVGGKSAPKTVTLTNTGNAPLVINSVMISGTNSADFTPANSCISPVAVGASCTVTITFSPSGLYTRTASLVFTDSAAGKTQTVAMSGHGTSIEISPSSLQFGSVPVGQTSQPRNLTVTNPGSSSIHVTQVYIAGAERGDFSQTNSCYQIAPGGTCTITVTFIPTAKGPRSAEVQIGTTGGPQAARVSGTGT